MTRPLDPRLPRTVPRLRRLLAAVAALQAVGAVAAVVAAVQVADVLAAVVVLHRPAGQLTGPLVTLAVALGVRATAGAAQEWLAARGSYAVRADLRAAVLDAVRRLGPAWAQRQPAGRLTAAAGPGLDDLDGYVTRALPALVAAVVVPLVALAAIARFDWRSALILLVVLPLVPLFMALIGVTTSRQMRERYTMLARMSGQFLDLVTGLASLRVYGAAERQVATVRRATEAFRRQTMATLRTAFLSGLVLDLVATMSVALVAVDIGLRLDHGSTDLRTAMIVLLLTPELFAPLRAFGAQHHASVAGTAAAAAALDLVDEAAACPSPDRGDRAARTTGAVRTVGLTVDYPERDRPALTGLTLAIEPGEIVALRGPSGAGKSTVLAALLGFVRPSAGSAAVDTGRGWLDPADDPTACRSNIAWLPQRPRATQHTVADEVRLGDPAADSAALDAVLAACACPPSDTVLGEDGTAVSAGQLRRVALARALLRARARLAAGAVPLLLLDEPSEDLDAVTEQTVTAVIAGLAGRATVVIATHSDRLAAVADRVVELDGGRITAQRRQAPRRADDTDVPPAIPPTVAPPATPTGGLVARSVWSGRRALRGELATWRRLVAAAALSAAAGVTGLALTATSVWLICRAAQHPNVQALALGVVGVRTFALGRPLLRYAERLVAHEGALRLLGSVRAAVFAALVPLVPRGVDLRRGDLLRRFIGDVDAVQEGIVRAVVPAAGALATAAAAVALAGSIDPGAGRVLGLALLVGLVGSVAVPRLLAGTAAGRHGADTAAARDTAVENLLTGLPELVAYAADGREAERVLAADRRLGRAGRPRARAAASGVALGGLALAAALPLVLAAGAHAATAGRTGAVSAGVLVACVLVGFDALSGLAAAAAAWTHYRASAARITALLDTPPAVPEPVVALVPPGGATGLSVHGASLSPTPSAPAVVTGLDLDLEPGERVAVVGPSGSGKSTLLAAALRLVPPRSGRIDLRSGGVPVPLDRVRPADLPPLVAGSLQGDHVFDASLRDNLRVVRPAATDDELDDVARRAGLADVLRCLPQGWDTGAGPDGAGLSGGQRQRLLLARALLADPEVLVLDEPTAHLDATTEAAIMADLLDQTRGRTTVISTHRCVGGMDRVVDLSPAGERADQPRLTCAP